MKRWRKQILGITLAVALATITAAPAALAALDFTSALKLFGITYVVDLFQTQINDFINTLTARQNVSAKESTKVVPIISVGTGAHVGAAQVTGPAAMVAKVQAVGQLEGDFFGGMRAKVLVPLDGRNPLQGMRRVDQVGISAIIDINIEAASSPSPAPPSLVPDSKPNPPQLVPGQPSQPQPLPVCPSVSVGLTGGAGNSKTTLANIGKAFDELAAKVKCGDKVLIYICGHGRKDGGIAIKSPSGKTQELMKPKDEPGREDGKDNSLKDFLDKIPSCPDEDCEKAGCCCDVTVILESCFAGSFKDADVGGEGCKVVGTSDKTEAWATYPGGGVYTRGLVEGMRDPASDADDPPNGVEPSEAHENGKKSI